MCWFLKKIHVQIYWFCTHFLHTFFVCFSHIFTCFGIYLCLYDANFTSFCYFCIFFQPWVVVVLSNFIYIWDDLPSLDKMDQTHFGQLNISMKFDLLEGWNFVSGSITTMCRVAVFCMNWFCSLKVSKNAHIYYFISYTDLK